MYSYLLKYVYSTIQAYVRICDHTRLLAVPVVGSTVRHVRELLQESSSLGLKIILLAGGFTESSFVRAYFKEQIAIYAPGVTVVEVPSPGKLFDYMKSRSRVRTRIHVRCTYLRVYCCSCSYTPYSYVYSNSFNNPSVSLTRINII